MTSVWLEHFCSPCLRVYCDWNYMNIYLMMSSDLSGAPGILYHGTNLYLGTFWHTNFYTKLYLHKGTRCVAILSLVLINLQK